MTHPQTPSARGAATAAADPLGRESGASNNPRILVVEDEAHLSAALKLNFELEGYHVDVAASARAAERYLVHPTGYDVIILDVMLPDMSGFAFCAKLREAGNYTCVLMLTARSSAEDRTQGLDAGADDYLPKPFDLGELLARVRSLLRRRRWDERVTEEGVGPRLHFGDVSVNFDTHDVMVAGSSVKLTQLELDLLRFFAENPGRVIGREELLLRVWKLRNYPNTRTVDNFIVRLRKALEPEPAHPRYFISVRGSGYKFLPPPG